MGGDFVSTFRGIVKCMDHGEVPNIFPQTWKKGPRWLAGWHADRVRRTGWATSGSELGAREARGSRIGAGGLQTRYGSLTSSSEELGAAEPIDWRASDLHARGTGLVARGSERRPADVACGLEIGVVGRQRDADRSWGPAQWWRVHRSGTGWVEPGNRRGPTQKVIACVSRGKSSPQRLFIKSMRH